jgi:hypothetical protein
MTEAIAKQVTRLDPQDLLTRAVEKGASLETLERLVALAKDVREVQAREAWHYAMAEFQRRCPSIKKTATAQIATAKGYYSYRYAALDEIMEVIRPLLGELGLSVSWSTRVEPQRVIISCRIAHVLGHSENSGEVSMPIADSQDRSGGNPAQKVGSALTYARRYSLLCVTGLSPEDDDDGQAMHPSKRTEKPESPAAAQSEKDVTKGPRVDNQAEAPPDGDLLTVDTWRGRYESCVTYGHFLEQETQLATTWLQYDNEEKVALKMIRDKTKTRLMSVGASGQPKLV